MHSAETTRNNLRGGLLMVVAMASFAIEDMLIKLVAHAMPAGQIILLLGLGATAILAVIARRQGAPLISPVLLQPMVMLRNGAEMIGAGAFVTALTLMPLSTASALHQTLPLVMTLGAAIVLREQVGWRRWSAVVVGFLGVLVILRPTGAGFAPLGTLATLIAVLGLAIRDLATRRIVGTVASLSLAVWGSAMFIPAGLILMLLAGQTPVWPQGIEWPILLAISVMGVVGYWLMVVATRVGEITAVVPYRYSRLVFAMVLGAIAFGERPDGWMLLGSAMIVGSGLYTFFRERARQV